MGERERGRRKESKEGEMCEIKIKKLKKRKKEILEKILMKPLELFSKKMLTVKAIGTFRSGDE